VSPRIAQSVLADRATGVLLGLAIGDALGMPTQSMSRKQITLHYGPIDRLRDAVAEQPIAPSLQAGSVTDDTEQALLLARLLIEGRGRIEPRRFADALAEWEADMEARGSLDLLGPSTKAAIAAIRAGAGPDDDPGKSGTTNGAAMRIAPVGIAFPVAGGQLAAAVVEASKLTHNTGLALGAAGAVAAAISSALDHPDCSVRDSTQVAAQFAAQLEGTGNWVAGGSIGVRIGWAAELVHDLARDDVLDVISTIVGTSVASQESVPAAFAFATRFADDPFQALCLAAQVGGDTDTIAAMTGAMLGAHYGVSAWPTAIVEEVVSVNGLELAPLVDKLLVLRQSAAGHVTP
jgi:ADP-ribosylglycohydrolase